MHTTEEEEIKKEFQLERVILFTDAVFAIILTIMVLDIKLPEGVKLSDPETIHHAFKEVLFKFLSYFVTFMLVARFWMVHLRLFRYLKDYDSRLLTLNLLFLFTVTLFPFAVSMIVGKIEPSATEFNWIWSIYVIIVYSTVFTQSLITAYLLQNRERLCVHTASLEDHFQWRVQKMNFILIPILVTLIIVFNYMGLNFYYTMFTVAIYGIVSGKVTKRYYPNAENLPPLFKLFRSRTTEVKKTKAIRKHS